VSLDQFMDRRHDPRRYNCAHFSRDVLEYLTGREQSGFFAGLALPPEERDATAARRQARLLDQPVDPCLVWSRRATGLDHLGVYHAGRVIHLPEGGGVQFVPLEVFRAGCSSVRFVAC
jgi:hypothetical protein